MSGDRLAYTQQSAQLDIWRLTRSGRHEAFQAEEVVSSTQEDTHPSLSPNGSRLAFISERSGHPEIWVKMSKRADPTQVTSLRGPELRSVTWASDGDQIAFVAQVGGQSNLFSVPASGGSPTQITETDSEVLTPRWGPEDRWIYYASNRTGAWEVWRTSPSQSRTQQVTRGGAVVAQESESGETLYVVRSDTVGVWAAELDTTNFPLVTRPLTRRDTIESEPSLFSSGDASNPTDSSDYSAGKEEIAFRQILVAVGPRDRHNWWVENSGIYFLDHRRFRTAVLTYFDFRSGRTIPMYTFPNWHESQRIAVGPDGRSFAYTHVSRRESDVMLIDDLEE